MVCSLYDYFSVHCYCSAGPWCKSPFHAKICITMYFCSSNKCYSKGLWDVIASAQRARRKYLYLELSYPFRNFERPLDSGNCGLLYYAPLQIKAVFFRTWVQNVCTPAEHDYGKDKFSNDFVAVLDFYSQRKFRGGQR